MNLPDGLMEAVKERAASEGRTQTSVIEQAIRQYLRNAPRHRHRPMPTYGEPGVDGLLVPLEDKHALEELLDEADAQSIMQDSGDA